MQVYYSNDLAATRTLPSVDVFQPALQKQTLVSLLNKLKFLLQPKPTPQKAWEKAVPIPPILKK